MLSHLLLLPSESYIGEQYPVVDVHAIFQVREFIRRQLASALEAEFAAVYALCNTGRPYDFTGAEAGTRALKNTVLAYLMLLNKPEYNTACTSQLEQADNMTDASAALRSLINNPSNELSPLTEKAVSAFYEKWKHEALVVEQWFSMQAGANLPGNLTAVLQLMQHEAFDMKNPNKVRSVIGAFCVNNLVAFHNNDGSGYRFLADQVLTLNALNPQIASRMLTPLTRWKRQPENRRQLIKAQLERIMASDSLSPDVNEVVSKSLQA
jgi:aminopeptidase N